MMKLHVHSDLLTSFPAMTIGIVAGNIESEKPEAQDVIKNLQSKAIIQLKETLGDLSLTEHPHVQSWREAYKTFGAKPKKHKPTHEALARRLLKTEEWPVINPLVDLYLTNQVFHLLPHGGYDTTAIEGTVTLSHSTGNEVFEPLGGGEEMTDSGEVVYRDNKRVLTRRWNYRDCDATKITPQTTSFVLVIEAANDTIAPETIATASQDLANRCQSCFEGEFSYQTLSPTPHDQDFIIE